MNESKPDNPPAVAVAAPAEGVRKALEEARDVLRDVYMTLPKDAYPGPPTSLLERIEAALAAPPQQSGMVMGITEKVEELLDVWDDRLVAPEARCYESGTFEAVMNELSAMLAAHQPGASPVKA
jgi:hypothetical protein